MSETKKIHEAGLAIRAGMFGPGAIDAINATPPYLQPMQDMVTRKCFGEVWSQPELDRRTRSLVTMAMLIALNRPHELRMHTKGAVANGATLQEIQALARHAAEYCGIPASVDAYVNTYEALKELGLIEETSKETKKEGKPA